MNEALALLAAGLAGALIGAIFFGGLWWTVRRGLSSKQPALWFLGSLVLRTGITLAGFYFVSNQRLVRLLLCVFGFVMARLVVTQITRPPGENRARPAQETRNAP
jgi:F1F0 ATPase subunit 2